MVFKLNVPIVAVVLAVLLLFKLPVKSFDVDRSTVKLVAAGFESTQLNVMDD